jgi:hypothetical protein
MMATRRTTNTTSANHTLSAIADWQQQIQYAGGEGSNIRGGFGFEACPTVLLE